MKVELLVDIEDVGTKDDPNEVVGLKTYKRVNRKWTPPKKTKDGWVESTEPRFKHVALTAGSVVECSEATGKKWIGKNWAKEYVEPTLREVVKDAVAEAKA